MNNKIKSIHVVIVFVLVMSGANVALAGADSQPFMVTAGATSQPIGHYQFCKRNKRECSIRSSSPARIRLTPQNWNELVATNASVNLGYEQVTDLELFGKPEVWAYPRRAGDCEDLALQKRRVLMQRGWPVGSLLVTVVRQASGEGHAVLTVLTDRGDLVLDNLEPRVLVWSDTNLSFVKRQSEFHTGRWTQIDDDRPLKSVGSLSR